ncbi:MAG: DUF374 domain-containing protein [Woeseiaceae bacterium]|nr:DUF374 domain-containing protein [Woeseiaceae bacterium]
MTNLSDAHAAASSRRLTWGRRMYYRAGMPVLRAIAALLWWSYRKEYVIGADTASRLIASRDACAPVYWHQHSFCCLQMMREWIAEGFSAGFIVSASVDGDVPARIAESWGATVVRGSAKQTSALAMRDLQRAMRNGVSIVTAADGPVGPCYEFKAGVVLMARIGGAPLVPLSCAADRAWYFRRWDRFMLPKLRFARVALAVGEPLALPRDARVDALEDRRIAIQDAGDSLMRRSKEALESRT